jgi:hypothetical protein
MSASAAVFCSAVSFSFLIRRSRLPDTVARPLSTAAWAMSTITTFTPATAQACAMPLPIVPAPMMPTVWMAMRKLLEETKKGEKKRVLAAGAAAGRRL